MGNGYIGGESQPNGLTVKIGGKGGVVPYLLMTVAAVVGVAVSWERATRPDLFDQWQLMTGRLLILASLIVDAVVGVRSINGFLLTLLMPIGAYKVSRVISEPVMALLQAHFGRPPATPDTLHK